MSIRGKRVPFEQTRTWPGHARDRSPARDVSVRDRVLTPRGLDSSGRASSIKSIKDLNSSQRGALSIRASWSGRDRVLTPSREKALASPLSPTGLISPRSSGWDRSPRDRVLTPGGLNSTVRSLASTGRASSIKYGMEVSARNRPDAPGRRPRAFPERRRAVELLSGEWEEEDEEPEPDVRLGQGKLKGISVSELAKIVKAAQDAHPPRMVGKLMLHDNNFDHGVAKSLADLVKATNAETVFVDGNPLGASGAADVFAAVLVGSGATAGRLRVLRFQDTGLNPATPVFNAKLAEHLGKDHRIPGGPPPPGLVTLVSLFLSLTRDGCAKEVGARAVAKLLAWRYSAGVRGGADVPELVVRFVGGATAEAAAVRWLAAAHGHLGVKIQFGSGREELTAQVEAASKLPGAAADAHGLLFPFLPLVPGPQERNILKRLGMWDARLQKAAIVLNLEESRLDLPVPSMVARLGCLRHASADAVDGMVRKFEKLCNSNPRDIFQELVGNLRGPQRSDDDDMTEEEHKREILRVRSKQWAEEHELDYECYSDKKIIRTMLICMRIYSFELFNIDDLFECHRAAGFKTLAEFKREGKKAIQRYKTFYAASKHHSSNYHLGDRPPFKVATEALRVASGEQATGLFYKTKEEALEGLREWSMLLSTISAGCSLQDLRPAHMSVQLERLWEKSHQDDIWKGRHYRIEEAQISLTQGEMYRGMNCSFPGGEKVLEGWQAMKKGDAAGTTALTSVSLSPSAAKAFMNFDSSKNVWFIFRGVIHGLYMPPISVAPHELEVVMPAMQLFHIDEDPKMVTMRKAGKSVDVLKIVLRWDRSALSDDFMSSRISATKKVEKGFQDLDDKALKEIKTFKAQKPELAKAIIEGIQQNAQQETQDAMDHARFLQEETQDGMENAEFDSECRGQIEENDEFLQTQLALSFAPTMTTQLGDSFDPTAQTEGTNLTAAIMAASTGRPGQLGQLGLSFAPTSQLGNSFDPTVQTDGTNLTAAIMAASTPRPPCSPLRERSTPRSGNGTSSAIVVDQTPTQPLKPASSSAPRRPVKHAETGCTCAVS